MRRDRRWRPSPPEGYTRCLICKEDKPDAAFHVRRDGRRENCQSCQDEQNRAVQAHQWEKAGIRGMTHERYDEMFKAQDGRCAICGKTSRPGRKRLGVDHDHSTGTVRALLCFNCNHALGKFDDDPALVEKARQYLLKHGR